MSRLSQRDYTYFTTVRGMCRSCRKIVPARVFFRAGKVWQQSLCPDCGGRPALIASDSRWYLENAVAQFTDRSPLKGSHLPVQGCPDDCGPCSWHASPCQLPVVSVTNDCELGCPICFTYNRPDRKYFMPVEEMAGIVDWVVSSSGPVDLINITGGEPTRHPDILDILAQCKRPEIGRVTMNSNGLRLARDIELCEKLAGLGVHVILSFNTIDPAASFLMHGADLVEQKLRAIENLTSAGVKITLLNVMVRGVNEDATGALLDMMRENDSILSLTVQTMTHTGQGGGKWKDRGHIPVDEAAGIVCSNSAGSLEPDDFMARPSAHPLCYLTCYMLRTADGLIPFTHFAAKEDIVGHMKDSYLIRLPEDGGFFKEAVNGLFANGGDAALRTLKGLVKKLYPPEGMPGMFERQRISESAVRTVYIHAHMDEDNFDCTRAMLCPDLVPAEPGRMIPACTYNLFYRMKDERFYAAD